MKVLIVEDNFLDRRLLTRVLSEYGSCEVAVNGKEAVDAFRLSVRESDPYDLICLDILMPELDGRAVLKQIRELEAQNGIFGLQGVKIIMTSAVDDPSEIVGAFTEQCEDYLVKPIDVRELKKALGRLGLP